MFVMILSQAFNSVILPVTVACILYLGNRRDLMGEHKFSKFTNIILVAILVFSIVTSWMGFEGLMRTIEKANQTVSLL